MEQRILIKYISAWNWQLLGIMFLIAAMILLSVPRTMISLVLFISALVLATGCFILARQRQKEIFKDE